MIRIHATAIARAGRAVLLLGPSGAGKSDLALRLIDRGWRLVADDQVELIAAPGRLMAGAPASIAGLIEVRGVGILPESPVIAPVALAIDLAGTPERLPALQRKTWLGIAIPLLALSPQGESAPLKVERALREHGLAVEDTAMDATPSPATAPMLVVTGMSGAGKATALKALEDIGYEAVDNLPLRLLDALNGAGEDGDDRPLAFGIDTRTRAFDAETLVERLRALRDDNHSVRLVYLDCSDDVLARRFSETRRRHPLADDRPTGDGIDRERDLTAPLRRWADMVIDTTELSVTDLRRRIAEQFGRASQGGLSITVQSFGFAHGLPRDADLVFDMRFLANPHWDPALRPLTGEDAAVAAYVAADPGFAPAVDRITDLLLTLLPGYGREGKAYLTIAIGCTGGRHRSVAVARDLHARLIAASHAPLLVHRDVARIGNDAANLTAAPQSGEQGTT